MATRSWARGSSKSITCASVNTHSSDAEMSRSWPTILRQERKLVLYLGIAATLGILWLMWRLQGRLPAWLGAEYLHWSPTPVRYLLRAGFLGLIAGMALAWLFRDYDKSPSLAFVSVWIG